MRRVGCATGVKINTLYYVARPNKATVFPLPKKPGKTRAYKPNDSARANKA